jgi:para-aminobenzoate synthetase component 1
MVVSEFWTARNGGLDPETVLSGNWPGLARPGSPGPGLPGPPFALLHGGSGTRFTILGIEALGRLIGPETADIEFRREGELPPILPDFVGFATYEWGTALEALVPAAPVSRIALPAFSFVLYRHLLVHDRQSGLLYESERHLSGSHAPAFVPDEGRRSLLVDGPFIARFLGDSEDGPSYRAKVESIRALIGAGEVYQACLTRQEEWAHSGDLRALGLALLRANHAPFSAFIAEPDHALLSSSPERLARLEGGCLETRPIKGTAPRGRNEEEDRALAAGLLASEKDLAELAMIVDLERNDLARTCLPGTTRVEAFPLLETYANVHHLVASIKGTFDPRRGLRGLLEAIFPGGSITGCPKIAAMRAIRSLEPEARSAYTGSIGWFAADLGCLDLNIAIRTLWADSRRLRFGTGGAVTWDSDPEAEYQETLHKARSILECLNSFPG